MVKLISLLFYWYNSNPLWIYAKYVSFLSNVSSPFNSYKLLELKCTLLNSHVKVSKTLCGVILMCSVINVYKVVQARKGSMLLALAMVMLLSFVLLYIDSRYSIGVMCFLLFPPSFILLLFFWEEFWHGMSHSFVLALPAFSFPSKEREKSN